MRTFTFDHKRFPPNKYNGYSPPVEMVDLFELEMPDRAPQIDPNDEYGWYELTLGWAIGKGMSINDDPENADLNSAHAFASYIRYNTDLG